MITIEIVMPPASAFEAAALDVLATHLTRTTERALSGISRGVKAEIVAVLEASDTFASLNIGQLWHLMGLARPVQMMDSIVRAVADSLEMTNVPIRAVGNALSGGLILGILRSDFSQVLGLQAAAFTSENGFDVPWLNWLLTQGNKKLIADYTYLGKPLPQYSRTGVGIMVKSKRGWGIPTEWSGTPADNWLTRALGTLEVPIAAVLQMEIQKHI